MSSILLPARPTWLDKTLVLALGLFFAAFAVLVEMRSCFMEHRRTDAGCYFRAAWAVRTGADVYRVTDDNGWHYNYPPPLAILLVPLADAPASSDRSLLLPYPVSVALWFVFNFACGLLAVHWLATALEGSAPVPVGCQAWWRRRVLPLLFCLPPVAHTLMRGQVNLLVLLLLAGMMTAHLRGRSATAGAWLAAAICIKIIPAFLLVYPLWRRDGRFLLGCAAGLVVGLVVMPGVVFGPAGTLDCYRELGGSVLAPGLVHEGADDSRAKELTNVTRTDSQSLVSVLHNTLHWDPATRPDHAELWVRVTALAASALLTLLTLLAARRRKDTGSTDGMLTWGALILVMLFASPVSHVHYFCLCLPLVMALRERATPSGWALAGGLALAAAFIAGQVLPQVPEWIALRDLGLALYPALALWFVAILQPRSGWTAQPGVALQPLRG